MPGARAGAAGRNCGLAASLSCRIRAAQPLPLLLDHARATCRSTGSLLRRPCYASVCEPSSWCVRDFSVLATGLGFIVALVTIKGGLRPPPLDFLARH